MKKKYDVIVIGAGSGGLNIASFMNRVGFSVLLIDKSDKNIGGDCLNFGCVPSKALIHVSKIMHNARESKKFSDSVNVTSSKDLADLQKVFDYVKQKQKTIRIHENADYFRKKGISVELGVAKFHSKDTIIINGKLFSAKKIVLATGSRPRKLDIAGVEKVNYQTNETIFDLKKLPKRLVVVGGGPIGMELSQAFSRLGSEVHIIQRGSQFLPKEEKEIADILCKQFEKEGIIIHRNSIPISFSDENKIVIEKEGKKENISFDEILISVGRKLNIENLDLEKADIKTEKGRILVNDYLQTTNKNVFVCGDIAGSYQFTHVAELHASIILSNFFKPKMFWKKVSYDKLSWVTYTSPEIATFGLNKKELENRGINFQTIEQTFEDEDRAIVDEDIQGKLLLYVSKNKILGGSMISQNAGELTQELILANTLNIPIQKIFSKIYPYPTASRINKKAISQEMAKKLTPFAKKLLKFMY